MVNDDLRAGHNDIDAAMAAVHQEHTIRLAAALDLAGGLAAILAPDKDADGNGSAAGPDQITFGAAPFPGEDGVAARIAQRVRPLDFLAYLCQRSRTRQRPQPHPQTRRRYSQSRLPSRRRPLSRR